MHSLVKAMENCNKESMIKGSLEYTDNIPYSSEDIKNENNKNYSVMRCLEGLISSEEYNTADAVGREVYNKYIFKSDEEFGETFVIADEDIEDLIDLRMTVCEKSTYIDRLDRLMFHIYFKKGKTELAGLVQEIYDNHDWAKEMIKIYPKSELSLIFQEDQDEYKKQFGIKTEENKVGEEEESSAGISKEIQETENWILRKYGGSQYGEKTGMVCQ